MFNHLKLKSLTKYSPYRKIALGTWSHPQDPSVYGLLKLNLGKTLSILEKYNLENHTKITINHLIAKALSKALYERPEINGLIRFNKIFLREAVRVFFQVNLPSDDNGEEIAKATLAGIRFDIQKNESLISIKNKFDSEISHLKNKSTNNEILKTINIFKYVPWSLSKLFLSFSSWLTYTLNINPKYLGLPKDPFGSAMITNVGSLGLNVGWAPLVPYSRVPLILLLGKIEDQAIVINKEIVVAPILEIGVTFDHRFIEGVHAAHIAKIIKKCIEDNPEHELFH